VDYIDDNLVKIYTEGGACLQFDLKDIIHFHEIEDFELEPKIVVNKKRVRFEDLRKEKVLSFSHLNSFLKSSEKPRTILFSFVFIVHFPPRIIGAFIL